MKSLDCMTIDEEELANRFPAEIMNFLEIGGVVFKKHTFLFREEILLTRKAIMAEVLILADTS